MVAWFPVTVRVFHFLCHFTSNMSSCIGSITHIRYKGSSLTWYNHCLWRLSSVILHCAVVCPYNVTLIQWWVNGEHRLVGTCNRIDYSLGLLVSSIESYHYPIPSPGDSGSRSTSGGAGEGPGQVVVSKSYIEWTWTCMDKEWKVQLVCQWVYMKSVTWNQDSYKAIQMWLYTYQCNPEWNEIVDSILTKYQLITMACTVAFLRSHSYNAVYSK